MRTGKGYCSNIVTPSLLLTNTVKDPEQNRPGKKGFRSPAPKKKKASKDEEVRSNPPYAHSTCSIEIDPSARQRLCYLGFYLLQRKVLIQRS